MTHCDDSGDIRWFDYAKQFAEQLQEAIRKYAEQVTAGERYRD